MVLNQFKPYAGRAGVLGLQSHSFAKMELHFSEFFPFHNSKLVLAQGDILHRIWKGSGATTTLLGCTEVWYIGTPGNVSMHTHCRWSC